MILYEATGLDRDEAVKEYEHSSREKVDGHSYLWSKESLIAYFKI